MKATLVWVDVVKTYGAKPSVVDAYYKIGWGIQVKVVRIKKNYEAKSEVVSLNEYSGMCPLEKPTDEIIDNFWVWENLEYNEKEKIIHNKFWRYAKKKI